MDASAARRQHAHAPVSELVANALDDHRAGIGDGPGGRALIRQVLEEVLAPRALSRSCSRGEPFDRGGMGEAQQIAHETTDGEPELQRTSGAVALPERHLPGLAGRGRDEHAVVGDLLDSPRRGAEHEGLARPAFEDHLFVELTDARRSRTGARPVDAVQAAIGNRPAVDDGHALGAFARDDGASQRDPR